MRQKVTLNSSSSSVTALAGQRSPLAGRKFLIREQFIDDLERHGGGAGVTCVSRKKTCNLRSTYTVTAITGLPMNHNPSAAPTVARIPMSICLQHWVPKRQ